MMVRNYDKNKDRKLTPATFIILASIVLFLCYSFIYAQVHTHSIANENMEEILLYKDKYTNILYIYDSEIGGYIPWISDNKIHFYINGEFVEGEYQ